MTMTDYLPIEPLGLDSIEIEAFGSLFCRMAQSHSVSVYALSMHLRQWWKIFHPEDDRAKRNVINAMNPMLCGYGQNVETYSTIVKSATGCATIERTTFLSLKDALDPNGHGLVRPGRAWCPACLDEAYREGKTFYDRLVWAMPAIVRCPIHKITLSTKCPSCGAPQLHYHHLGAIDLCCKCKESLRSSPRTWLLVPQAPIYETECLELVLGIAKADLIVAPGAYVKFIEVFAEYLSPLSRKVSKLAYKAARRPQSAREIQPPRIDSLLRRCAAFGVNPADVLSNPVEAAKSACVLEFARLDLPVTVKPRRASEVIALAKRRLESELDGSNCGPVPSLRHIARELDVSTGFLGFHFPDLVARHSSLRKGNLAKMLQRDQKLALSFLLNGPVYQYPSAEFPNQDRLVEATVAATGIGIHQARNAVSAAFKERFGLQAFKRYQKRRRRDRSLKWPPCDRQDR